MSPTLESGDLILIHRLAYRIADPLRGDVVWVRDRGSRLIKRVVGLPGETVGFVDGVVTINGEPLAEPYCSKQEQWNYRAVQLGEDEYFVVGDNRAQDQIFGRARRERILGRAAFFGSEMNATKARISN